MYLYPHQKPDACATIQSINMPKSLAVAVAGAPTSAQSSKKSEGGVPEVKEGREGSSGGNESTTLAGSERDGKLHGADGLADGSERSHGTAVPAVPQGIHLMSHCSVNESEAEKGSQSSRTGGLFAAREALWPPWVRRVALAMRLACMNVDTHAECGFGGLSYDIYP